MSKFRKKPVVIEAVQLRWDTWGEMCDFLGPAFFEAGGGGTWMPGEAREERIALNIPTLEGVMRADQDDWIIRGVKDELYPCKPDIFAATYEAVEAVLQEERCSICGATLTSAAIQHTHDAVLP